MLFFQMCLIAYFKLSKDLSNLNRLHLQKVESLHSTAKLNGDCNAISFENLKKNYFDSILHYRHWYLKEVTNSQVV